jgi:hypothetical protein
VAGQWVRLVSARRLPPYPSHTRPSRSSGLPTSSSYTSIRTIWDVSARTKSYGLAIHSGVNVSLMVSVRCRVHMHQQHSSPRTAPPVDKRPAAALSAEARAMKG